MTTVLGALTQVFEDPTRYATETALALVGLGRRMAWYVGIRMLPKGTSWGIREKKHTSVYSIVTIGEVPLANEVEWLWVCRERGGYGGGDVPSPQTEWMEQSWGHLANRGGAGCAPHFTLEPPHKCPPYRGLQTQS